MILKDSEAINEPRHIEFAVDPIDGYYCPYLSCLLVMEISSSDIEKSVVDN